MIAFFYEVFPTRLRKILHLITALITSGFLASILATAFWCLPHSRMWPPQAIIGPEFCFLPHILSYNVLLFSCHIASTVAISVLPTVLLRRIPGGTKEAVFAFSVMGFGALTILASSITYLYAVKIQILSSDQNVKHSAVLGMVADQHSVFWAASLSVFQVRRLVELSAGPPQSDDGEALVIKVEKRCSVTVEIVSEWDMVCASRNMAGTARGRV